MAVTKFDEETIEKLISAIRKGATYKIACNYAGIDFTTYRKWMRRGKAEKDQNTEYAQFRYSIKKAQGETACKWLDVIENAMEKEWTAAAWKLERRYYADFSSNPMVRTEIKILQKQMKQLHDQKEIDHEGQIKELDQGSDKAPGRSSPRA